MDGVNQLIIWGMRALRAAAFVRGSSCLIRIAMCQEEANVYKRRFRNLLLFMVVAESINGLLTIVERYYGIA